MASVLDSLKRLEYEGYHFEVADGSLELLLRNSTGWEQDFFELESYRVIADHGEGQSTEATVKVLVGDERIVATAEGNGPVNALDGAVRAAIGSHYPALSGVHLVDYRVRVLDSAKGTGSVTRVLIDSTDGDRTWTTIGVSENIIAASWQALSDSIVYGLLHAGAASDGWAAPGPITSVRSPRSPTVTQPSFVPIVEADQVRPAYRLKVPSIWTQSRPSEVRGTSQPGAGSWAGPAPTRASPSSWPAGSRTVWCWPTGDSAEDAIAGCTAVAMRRCASFGRAPAVYDLTFAFTLWGFLGGAPADLVEARSPLFRSASHHYQAQRAIADSVHEETLRLTPEAVADRIGEWRELIGLADQALTWAVPDAELCRFRPVTVDSASGRPVAGSATLAPPLLGHRRTDGGTDHAAGPLGPPGPAGRRGAGDAGSGHRAAAAGPPFLAVVLHGDVVGQVRPWSAFWKRSGNCGPTCVALRGVVVPTATGDPVETLDRRGGGGTRPSPTGAVRAGTTCRHWRSTSLAPRIYHSFGCLHHSMC